MSVLTVLLINSLSALAGTFIGNFALLWLISRQAQAVERENLMKFQQLQAAVVQQLREELKKKQEYIKMES